jgi:imidazolonepropionase-like amidohydrolase
MKTLFKNCGIIDGLGDRIEKGWLLIEEDRIALVGEEEVPQDIEAEVDQGHTIDAAGKSILPGLIDCHVHLTLDGSPDPMNNLMKTADPSKKRPSDTKGRAHDGPRSRL